jgi:hypothetical protein
MSDSFLLGVRCCLGRGFFLTGDPVDIGMLEKLGPLPSEVRIEVKC